RFGAGQIDLAVKKRPPGKFSRLGHPETRKSSERFQNRRHHGAPTVEMQFAAILAGETRRSREKQNQPPIKLITLARLYVSQLRLARRGKGTSHFPDDCARGRP